jgi:hypothetical protein
LWTRRKTSWARSSARPAVLNRSRDEGEHEVLVAINQFAERIVVARAAPFDECSLGGRIHPPAY